MKIIGIDYGRKKIGISIGDSEVKLAEPLKVVRVETNNEAIERIAGIAVKQQAEKLVVGISEGKMAEETKKFVKGLLERLNIPVVLHDETLSTHEAQEMSIKAGIGRKKRKKMEDAYASAVMLQSYFDE